MSWHEDLGSGSFRGPVKRSCEDPAKILQKVLASRSWRWSVLDLLVWKPFWDALRRFFYEDLVRSSRRSFLNDLVKLSQRSSCEVLVSRHSVASCDQTSSCCISVNVEPDLLLFPQLLLLVSPNYIDFLPPRCLGSLAEVILVNACMFQFVIWLSDYMTLLAHSDCLDQGNYLLPSEVLEFSDFLLCKLCKMAYCKLPHPPNIRQFDPASITSGHKSLNLSDTRSSKLDTRLQAWLGLRKLRKVHLVNSQQTDPVLTVLHHAAQKCVGNHLKSELRLRVFNFETYCALQYNFAELPPTQSF